MVTSKKKVAVRCGTVFTAAALALPLLSFVGTGTASAAKVANDVSFPRSRLCTRAGRCTPPDQLQPLGQWQSLCRDHGAGLRASLPLQPHHQQVHAVAGHGRQVEREHLHHRVRNGVNWSDGSALTGADVAFRSAWPRRTRLWLTATWPSSSQGVTANGNTVTVNFTSPPPYTAWQHYLWNQPVLPKSTLVGAVLTDQVTGANLTPVGTGPMTPDHLDDRLWLDRGLLPGQPQLVGHQPAAPLVQVQVPVRPGKRLQQRRAVQPGDQPDRLEQQLPARHLQPDQRPARHRRLWPADLLQDDPVHAFGQHGLAGAQHHQGAHEQRQLPQGPWPTRSTRSRS